MHRTQPKTLRILSNILVYVLIAGIIIISSPAYLANADSDIQHEDLPEYPLDPDNDHQDLPGQILPVGIENSSEDGYEDDNLLSAADTVLDMDPSRFESFNITMPQLDDRERTVIVYLPPDYDSGASSYPVLYIQGAQDLFEYYLESSQEWKINQPLFEFYTHGIQQEAILVAVAFDPINIWDEYSPWVNDDMYRWMDPYEANRIEGGEGDAYLSFIIDTLKPVVDHRYRTLQDKENTAIGGYNMGGLISIYSGLTRPDVFSQVMAMSPAVWFAEDGGTWLSRNRLIEYISLVDAPLGVSFFIDVAIQDRTTDLVVRPAIIDAQGKKISFPRAYLEGAFAVVSALIERGHPQTKIHSEIVFQPEWSMEVYEPTRSLPERYYFPLFIRETPSEFHSIDFKMEPYLMDRNRRVWIYLPPNYDPDPSNGGYQVIYMLSSQHVFGEQTGAFVEPFRDWKFDETLDSLYSQTRKGTIAVGIEYDRNYPWDESMPWDNNNMDNWLRLEGKDAEVKGRGIAFLNFIVNDLKPYIDSNYNTKPEREHTAIGGGSRYGYFALFAGLNHPDVFSKVMSMSPAVWLAEGGPVLPLGQPTWLVTNQLSAWFDNHQAPKNVQYFIYIGTNEYSGPGSPYPHAYNASGRKLTMPEVYVSGADRMKNKLTGQGVTTLKYEKIPGGTHNPEIWRLYVAPSLIWFGFYE